MFSSEKKSSAGRPAFDVLLMFKILILKTVYNHYEVTDASVHDSTPFLDLLPDKAQKMNRTSTLIMNLSY
ncbi:MAG: transposase [Planctomycetaceae bacterium]|nr:transposase [Planctomycetaceae bacterium]